jgi:predicted membrane-bound spermidine synthase
MVLHAILQKDDVTHVTVIEKEQDVINLVAASFANDPRVEIIHADAMMYCPPAGVTYNACWLTYGQTATANSHRWISWKLSTGTSVNGRARGAGRSVSKSTLSFKILGLIEYNF